jgi:hypothetical protein
MWNWIGNHKRVYRYLFGETSSSRTSGGARCGSLCDHSIDFTSTYVDFTSLEPGFVLQERIAGPEVRNRDSQMRAHLGLNHRRPPSCPSIPYFPGLAAPFG